MSKEMEDLRRRKGEWAGARAMAGGGKHLFQVDLAIELDLVPGHFDAFLSINSFVYSLVGTMADALALEEGQAGAGTRRQGGAPRRGGAAPGEGTINRARAMSVRNEFVHERSVVQARRPRGGPCWTGRVDGISRARARSGSLSTAEAPGK